MIEKSDSKWLSLATAPILGQPPRSLSGCRGGSIGRLLILASLLPFACSEPPQAPTGSQEFHLTKLDRQGRELTADQGPWACVRDRRTELVWEVKRDDEGLHDRGWTYSWYRPSSGVGDTGTPDGGTCFDLHRQDPDNLLATNEGCDTYHFIQAVNAEALCGFRDWRLPTRQELRTLLDDGAFPGMPMIQEGYFPRSQRSSYWSATPGAPDSDSVWALSFGDGHEGSYRWDGSFFVRLVRGAQFSP